MDDCREVTVNVTVIQAGEVVRIQIFTTAYRKVCETTMTTLPTGTTAVKVPLMDKQNRLLSNGCYYLVVTTNAGRSIGKLVVLR
jgi:hypothetical protein